MCSFSSNLPLEDDGALRALHLISEQEATALQSVQDAREYAFMSFQGALPTKY